MDKPREDLLVLVRDSLKRAEAYGRRYRPWDPRLMVISIISGAIATLLAGGMVAGGQPALDAAGGWRVVCTVVAVFTAAGTVAGALHKSLQITTRIASAEKCTARLRALDATIVATDIAAPDALEIYRRIAEDHADCLA